MGKSAISMAIFHRYASLPQDYFCFSFDHILASEIAR